MIAGLGDNMKIRECFILPDYERTVYNSKKTIFSISFDDFRERRYMLGYFNRSDNTSLSPTWTKNKIAELDKCFINGRADRKIALKFYKACKRKK